MTCPGSSTTAAASRRARTRRLLLCLAAACLGAAARAAPQDRAPLIPGLRAPHGLDETQAGELLFEELRCGACHAGRAPGAAPLPAPDLSEVGWRVAPEHLERLLADPAAAEPGTKMPALLADEPPERRAEIARALTHFLVARSERPFGREPVDENAARAGGALFHRVGCVACHPPRQPAGEGLATPAAPAGSVALDHVPFKYSLASLAEFLFRPGSVRPCGRMPDMRLARAEARAIASHLVAAGPPDAGPLEPDPALVDRGRGHFERLRCAACHALPGIAPPPPARAAPELDPARGCLADDARGAPRYDLDDAQRRALARALAAPPRAPGDDEQIARTLVRFRCLACHERDGRGGVPPALDPYFTTSEPDLGDEARIPPPLTGVGAKLRSEWLPRVLFDGAVTRTYMHTRMPQYGEAQLAHLPALLRRADAGAVEPFDMSPPADDQERRTAREAGAELLGNRGLTCVSCHDFNGEPAITSRGMDLLTFGERLEPSWFARFVLAPQAVRPGIVMPESWPDGVAVHSGILDGDTEAQLRAIWYFLSLGTSAPDPPGIRPEPTRLAVTDTPRTYRGRSRVAGFRGIAVGFPGGLCYAFDANNGSLSAIWRGAFVSVRWDGQGAGDFHPGARPVELPRDVALWRLPDAGAPWPLRPRTDDEHPVNPDPLYPRDVGYRFRGYAFDDDQVPTLMYATGAVEVADRSVAEPGPRGARLARTLRFRAPAAETLTFRALAGAIEVVSERELRVPGLALELPPVPTTLRPLDAEQGTSELLLELALPAGESSFTLRYELLD